MNKSDTKQSILEVILTNQSIREVLASGLQPTDLYNLLLTSKRLYQLIHQWEYVINRLFYHRYLRIDRSMYYLDDADQMDKQNYELLCNSELVSFRCHIKPLQNIRSELYRNIFKILSENIEEAKNITHTIFQIFRQPQIPLPKLRKQNIGRYCNSTFQLFLSQLSVKDRKDFDEWSGMDELKKCLINQEQYILNQFRNTNLDLLSLRYSPEHLTCYSPTGSSFLNIIQLLILQIQRTILLSKQVLARHSANPINQFYEFIFRYSVFKNMMLNAEEQLSFLFTHFNQVFNLEFSAYVRNPEFSLWRIMIKKWVLHMRDYHESHSKVYNYLLLKQRENTLKEYIQSHEVNKQVQYKCQSQVKWLSQRYFVTHFSGCSNRQTSSELMDVLLQEYTEYLVDVSCDEYSVHWLGSTQIQLAPIYKQNQRQILALNKCHVEEILNIMMDPWNVKTYFEEQFTQLADRLKSCTIKHLVETTEQLLKLKISECSDNTDQQMCFKVDVCMNDQQVEYLCKQMQIPVDLGEYSIFFCFSETVSLEYLNKLVVDNKKDYFSDDQNQVESYVSDNEEQDIVQSIVQSS